ncbi:MAG: helix-turn-helix transcriptional regulator [Ktedonobacteraceae bacterium]|nr:helix-turn-helix transcriptional regulator [Ktedonobacteraceae bacterium]
MLTGDEIRRLRVKAHMSQAQLGARCFLSRDAIAKMEQQNKIINQIDTARHLATALSIPWEHVFGVPGLVQKQAESTLASTEGTSSALAYDHFTMGIHELLLACHQYGWSLEELVLKAQDELRRSNAMDSQQQQHGTILSRRQAVLAMASTPMLLLGRVSPAEPLSPVTAEEVLMQCASALPACLQLYRMGEIAQVASILPTYTNHLTVLAQQPSRLQKRAFSLASLSHRLDARLAQYRQDFDRALTSFTEAISYAKQAEDTNLQVIALTGKAHTLLLQKRPDMTRQRLLTLQEAEQYSKQVSPIIQARTYMGLGEAYASLGQDQEADRYIRLAHDTLPDHPEEDPYHIYTYYNHDDLFMFDGLTRLSMGDAKGAWAAFERLDEIVPETLMKRRVDVLSRQTITLVSLNNLDESCKKLEETVTKALALDYTLHYNGAYETYLEMQRKWGWEQKVRALAQLFTK